MNAAYLPPPLTDFERWIRELLDVPDDDDWYEGRIDAVDVPSFELTSLRLALDDLGADEVRCFDSKEKRIPPLRSPVATGYAETVRTPCAGARFALRRGSVPALLWIEVDPGCARLMVTCADEGIRDTLTDEVLNAMRGRSSAWRRQAIRFDPLERDGYVHLEPVCADRIHLTASTADQLRRNLVTPLLRFDEIRHRVSSRGVLLQGPPGGGKTWAARWVQAEVRGKATVVVATPAMFGSTSLLLQLYELVAADTPCLLVLDDLDVTIRSRFDCGADALGELLSRLDGPATVEGVFTIATTNHAEALDAALSERPGRFDVTIEIGDASPEARAAVLADIAMAIGAPLAQLIDLTAATEGWTLADITNLGNLALLDALDRDESPDLWRTFELLRGTPATAMGQGYL